MPNIGVNRAGIVTYQNHADLAVVGDIDYDITNAGQLLNLAKTKAKLEDPHADNTWDNGRGAAILTDPERAVFEEAILDSPEAVHAASVLLSYYREVKGAPLHANDNTT